MFHSLTVAARPSSTDETFEEQLQREESEGASLFAAPGRNSGSAGNAARERRERDRGESDLLCALCCLSCRSSEPPSPARVKRLSTAAVPVLGDQRWQTVIEACHWFCAPRDGSLRLGKLSGTRLDRLRAAALDAFQRALMSLPPSAPYAQLQEQAIEVARQKWEQTRSSALSRVSADGRLCCLTDTELAEMSRSAAAAQKALLQAWQQALQWLERLSSAAGPLRCKLQAIVWMMARRPEFEHASILFELYLRPGCGADDGNVAPVRQQMRLAVRRYRHLLLRTLQLALRQVEQCARTALVAPAALSFSRRGSRAIISDEPLLQNPSVLFAGRLLGHATFLSSAVAAHIGRSSALLQVAVPTLPRGVPCRPGRQLDIIDGVLATPPPASRLAAEIAPSAARRAPAAAMPAAAAVPHDIRGILCRTGGCGAGRRLRRRPAAHAARGHRVQPPRATHRVAVHPLLGIVRGSGDAAHPTHTERRCRAHHPAVVRPGAASVVPLDQPGRAVEPAYVCERAVVVDIRVRCGARGRRRGAAAALAAHLEHQPRPSVRCRAGGGAVATGAERDARLRALRGHPGGHQIGVRRLPVFAGPPAGAAGGGRLFAVGHRL
eukprot:ctg_1891.g634